MEHLFMVLFFGPILITGVIVIVYGLFITPICVYKAFEDFVLDVCDNWRADAENKVRRY